MKVLSPETRRKLSEARTRAWERKRKPGGYGDAYRVEVVKALEKIMCTRCPDGVRVACKRQVRENRRNGCMIACMNACLFIDEDLMAKEVPRLGGYD